jgi:ankyrin repeat protein
MVKLLLSKGAILKDLLLFHSFSEVNFQIIKYILKRGTNPEVTDYNGDTFLHKWCEQGYTKNVKYLIQHYNADVTAKNRTGQTPLHLASKGNINPLYKKACLKKVKFLIEEHNADPAVTCNEGKTALHYAAQNEDLSILRYLIEVQKQDIEATDNEGRTALHLACQYSSLWYIKKYLIEEHPKIIEAKDEKGKTVLHYCLEKLKENNDSFNSRNFKPVALILATKAKILKTLENKDTDLIFNWIKQSYESDIKNSKDEDEAVSCLIASLQSFQKKISKDNKTYIGYNPLLYIVCYFNTVDIAEYMFNQDLCYIENHFNGVDANLKIKLLLKSYLKFCCKNGFLDLTKFLFQEITTWQESFQHLTFDGSFLKTACKNKHFNVFKYLLEGEKSKDEAAEFLKDFPLHFACRYGSLDMVQYLTGTKQIDIEAKDKGGRTPLNLACHAGSIEITKYLIVNQNAKINTTDNKGRSVWHFACKSDCLELVKYISQKTKLDVNAQDEDGSTALHLFCEDYMDDPNLKIVKFLINGMKANLHLANQRGETPLHAYCQSDFPNVQIPKCLVNTGANILAEDKSAKTPLHVAKANFRLSIYDGDNLIPFLKAATKR